MKYPISTFPPNGIVWQRFSVPTLREWFYNLNFGATKTELRRTRHDVNNNKKIVKMQLDVTPFEIKERNDFKIKFYEKVETANVLKIGSVTKAAKFSDQFVWSLDLRRELVIFLAFISRISMNCHQLGREEKQIEDRSEKFPKNLWKWCGYNVYYGTVNLC